MYFLTLCAPLLLLLLTSTCSVAAYPPDSPYVNNFIPRRNIAGAPYPIDRSYLFARNTYPKAGTKRSVPASFPGLMSRSPNLTQKQTQEKNSAINEPFLQKEKKFQAACDANNGKCPQLPPPKPYNGPTPKVVSECSGAPGVCP